MDDESTAFHGLTSLIANQHKYTFITIKKLVNLLDKIQKACLKSEAGCYLEVKGIYDDHLEPLETALMRRGIRSATLMYEKPVATLIIKLMPGIEHESAHLVFIDDITNFIRNLPTHKPSMYAPVGATSFRGITGRSKQADGALQPSTRRPNEFPSFVIEAGYSESLRQLRFDAHWWLKNSKGQTKFVLMIQISKKPNKLVLECWTIEKNPSTHDARNRPALVTKAEQAFEINAAGDVQSTTTPPTVNLTIPYFAIFDAPHEGMEDIVFDFPQLTDIALRIFSRCL